MFKDYGDQVVVSRRPIHDPHRIPTPGEARQRERIQEAAARAKSVLAGDTPLCAYAAG